MGRLWAAFSGEHEGTPPSAQHIAHRTGMWGLLTGQHGDNGGSACRTRDMSESAIEQAATAYHEASHARAARVGGHQVEGMWAEGGSGLTSFSGKANLRAALVALVAGQEGEIAYLIDRHGYSRREAERRTHHGASSDRVQFAEAAAGTGYTWRGLQGEARRLVRRHGYTIETNAKPLARKGRRGGTWA